MDEPIFRDAADVPWVEVKAQSHRGQRVLGVGAVPRLDPDRLALVGRYDPGMVVERHGHSSDHIVFVLAGEVAIGERRCGPGTYVYLPEGAAFGPLDAGADGAELFELMLGDPRAVPADPEGFARLCAERDVVPLPYPPVTLPDWLGPRTD